MIFIFLTGIPHLLIVGVFGLPGGRLTVRTPTERILKLKLQQLSSPQDVSFAVLWPVILLLLWGRFAAYETVIIREADEVLPEGFRTYV